MHRSVHLTDRSSVGEARRAAMNIALSLGFGEERRNDIGIAVTEAATNIILHAKEGEFLICPSGAGGRAQLDLLGIDSGPGIRDVGRAMEDGFSTIGTAGEGLGAIGRLSNASSLFSMPDKGTVSWARFSLDDTEGTSLLGVVSVPIKGETVCGDGYFALPGESRSLYMVVDGLGHGLGAAEAAEEALAIVEESSQEQAAEILVKTHDALKKTRGAAMALAIIDHERKTLNYAGVGNIQATLTAGGVARTLISQNGTLGAVLPRVQEFSYPVARNTLLLMSSDGLATKAAVTPYPGLQGRHPALVAAVLYRDFSRRRDDATVMAVRLEDSRA